MCYKGPYSGKYRFTKQKGLIHPTKHELFVTWRMMNIRCFDTRHQSYHRYGGRGVEVCEQWRCDNPLGFYNFICDVGDRPERTTLDKVDNDGWYSPDNVRWATKKQQQNNLGIGLSNSSGELGVSWDSYKSAWVVQIGLMGETTNIGTFNFEDKALAAERYEIVKAAKLEFGDEHAYNYYLSLKDVTPVGKQKRRNKSSNYYGVCLHHAGKWRAFNNEYVNGKLRQKHLGLYVSEEDAYSAVLRRLEELKEVECEEDLQLGECHSIRH